MNNDVIVQGLQDYVKAVESNIENYRQAEIVDHKAIKASLGMIECLEKQIEKYRNA